MELLEDLYEQVCHILECYHRPDVDAEEVVRILRSEKVEPSDLSQVELEDEVRWTVINRIDRKTKNLPSWRYDPVAADEDDFFE